MVKGVSVLNSVQRKKYLSWSLNLIGNVIGASLLQIRVISDAVHQLRRLRHYSSGQKSLQKVVHSVDIHSGLH